MHAGHPITPDRLPRLAGDAAEDVAAWVLRLAAADALCPPDLSGRDVGVEDGGRWTPVFAPEAADAYDAMLDRARRACARAGVDPSCLWLMADVGYVACVAADVDAELFDSGRPEDAARVAAERLVEWAALFPAVAADPALAGRVADAPRSPEMDGFLEVWPLARAAVAAAAPELARGLDRAAAERSARRAPK